MATLQIRDIPEDVRQTLKARAAAAGQSLSEYASAELAKSARRPTLAELDERIRRRGRVETVTPASEALHQERQARGA